MATPAAAMEPQPTNEANRRTNMARISRHMPIAEWGLLLLLIFVLSDGPPPGVNEAHYWTKAKSFWEPDWCRRDLFLNSGNAHWVFFASFGALTQWFSLPAATWAGRCISWSMLASGWFLFVSAIRFERSSISNSSSWMRPGGLALLSFAIASLFWQCGHMAGEWVLGGCEAKIPSFAFVFAALGCLLRSRWRWATVGLAAAIALHPIVGGWSTLAVLYALATQPTGLRPLFEVFKKAPCRAGWVALSALGIASLGVLPALGLDHAPADVTQTANRIYVYGRLPHHLVAQQMPPLRILRFGCYVTLWLLARQRREWSAPVAFVQRMADASLWMVVVGLLLGFVGYAFPDAAASALKYYWFRLADIVVPIAVSMMAIEFGFVVAATTPARFPWCMGALLAVLTIGVSHQWLAQRRDPRPGADRQGQIHQVGQPGVAMQRFSDWKAMCEWVNESTDSDSLFLTPTHSQTFKWYAGRAELATWKDIPQDAASMVEWAARREKIEATGLYVLGATMDRQALLHLIDEYHVDFVVTVGAAAPVRMELPLAYRNASFRVFRAKQGHGLPRGSVPRTGTRGPIPKVIGSAIPSEKKSMIGADTGRQNELPEDSEPIPQPLQTGVGAVPSRP